MLTDLAKVYEVNQLSESHTNVSVLHLSRSRIIMIEKKVISQLLYTDSPTRRAQLDSYFFIKMSI